VILPASFFTGVICVASEFIVTIHETSFGLIALIKAAAAQTGKPHPADKILCI
jgi:hypothetical protein